LDRLRHSAKRMIIFTRKPGAEWERQFNIAHE
jgi:hypothetical protein